jgi:hypothetical protein
MKQYGNMKLNNSSQTSSSTTFRELTALLSLAFVSLLTANQINAATLTYQNNWNYVVPSSGISLSGLNYNASTTDLANDGQSTLATTVWSGGVSGEYGSSPAELNNGLYSAAELTGGNPNGYVSAGSTATTLLATPNSTYTINFTGGMNLTSIDVYSAMTGTNRAKQNWSLAYSLVGSGSYVDLVGPLLSTKVAQNSNGNRQGGWYNKVTLTLGASEQLLEVDSLQFTFLTPEYNPATDGSNSTMLNTAYREIDVFGTAIPEPSTYAMLLGGSVALFLIRRLRA